MPDADSYEMDGLGYEFRCDDCALATGAACALEHLPS